MTKEEEEKIHKIVENMSDEEIEDRIRQDEQGEEEAIEYIKKRIKVCNENADICDDNNFNEEATYLREESYMLETVLSMLKENSAEIEQKNTELAEKNAEIERLNRQIDLITEFLGERDLGYYKNETGGEILGIMRKYNKEDWKQYFERKVKDGRL